jgi:hypothetical protein
MFATGCCYGMATVMLVQDQDYSCLDEYCLSHCFFVIRRSRRFRDGDGRIGHHSVVSSGLTTARMLIQVWYQVYMVKRLERWENGQN